MTIGKELIELDVAEVVVRRTPRQDAGDIKTLAASIKNIGLLHPVIVDRNNVLIAGARRLAACRAAGMARIPALRADVEYNSLAALGIQSDENLCRQDLTAADLERHIRAKQSAAAAEGGAGRVLSGFRRLFTNG